MNSRQKAESRRQPTAPPSVLAGLLPRPQSWRACCPAHIGVEMELVAAPVPKFAWTQEDGETIEERRSRRAWRCPVPGCHFVALVQPDPEAQRRRPPCVHCGGRVEPSLPGAYGRSCRSCYNRQQRNRDTRRRHSAPAKPEFRMRLSGARRGLPQPMSHPWRQV